MTRELMLALSLAGLAFSRPVLAEEVDVVSMDDSHPSATATPQPNATATSTPEPTLAPPEAPSEVPTAATAPQGNKENLDKPSFDAANKPAAVDGSDEGLVIIAPGAASPEDSFEAFGIDSPFNWRERKKKSIGGPDAKAEAGDESIELNAPETSDFKEKVAVENSQGEQLAGVENYNEVERAGLVIPSAEFPMEGRILREKNGQAAFGQGHTFFMSVEPGRQVYPGSIYSIYRAMGAVQGGENNTDLGILFRAVGIARIIRVDSENTIARVEKQYDAVEVGDGLRLRDGDRARHFASLRNSAADAPVSDIKGKIAELQYGQKVVKTGGFVYLDIGKSAGAVPGMRLAVYHDLETSGDPLLDMPGAVGKIGEVEILSVQKASSTARIVKTQLGLQAGDRIRYR